LCSFGSFLEGLGERFTVIRYDKPGCGLSDRDGADLSFDGQLTAALAVADAVGADRFRLFGASQGGQLAAAIAAKHPERVEALVVYGMCARGGDLAPAEVRNSVVALVRAHWGLGLKAITGAFITDPTAEELDAFTRFQRASASADVAARLLEVYYETDVTALLPAIRARTAVLHREADKGTRFELGREVAALVPGATLIPLPGTSHLFYHGDWPAVLDALVGFLCEPVSPESRPDQSRHRQPPPCRPSDRRVTRGEHSAQARRALASPDRGVGSRAPAPSVNVSVVRPMYETESGPLSRGKQGIRR
jgi:pimeloyl-ACP methyl ester carboxylesterase